MQPAEKAALRTTLEAEHQATVDKYEAVVAEIRKMDGGDAAIKEAAARVGLTVQSQAPVEDQRGAHIIAVYIRYGAIG